MDEKRSPKNPKQFKKNQKNTRSRTTSKNHQGLHGTLRIPTTKRGNIICQSRNTNIRLRLDSSPQHNQNIHQLQYIHKLRHIHITPNRNSQPNHSSSPTNIRRILEKQRPKNRNKLKTTKNKNPISLIHQKEKPSKTQIKPVSNLILHIQAHQNLYPLLSTSFLISSLDELIDIIRGVLTFALRRLK